MRCLLASLPALALACGGTIEPIDPSTLHIDGSYDFVVADVQAEAPPQAFTFPNMGHAAMGQHARLDIRKVDAGFEAAITPAFGDPTEMTVALGKDGTLTLTGSLGFSSGNIDGEVTDTLQTIHLSIGSDGRLTGSFSAEGQESVSEGDVGWTGQESATGTIGADAVAPQARIDVLATSPSAVLPWDSFEVRMSEPVDALSGALSLAPGAASWELSPSPSWLGATYATGVRTSWSDVSGDSTLAVAAGLVDPTGNASQSASSPVHFLSVPSAAAFDGSTLPAMWGKASVATSPESCGQAASCVEIGPLDGPCNAPEAGIAGRLVAGGAKNVSITYRVRAASQYGGPPYFMGGLGLATAVPGKAGQLIGGVSPTLNATTDPTYGYASDWTTTVLPLTDTGSEVGFSLVPFAAMQTYCGGGPMLPPMTVVIDVAEVTTAP